jgi:hypothetical protein
VRVLENAAGQRAGRVDITLALSQVDVNVPVPDEAFTVNVPPDAAPLTLEELRQAGPMRDTAPGPVPAS